MSYRDGGSDSYESGSQRRDRECRERDEKRAEINRIKVKESKKRLHYLCELDINDFQVAYSTGEWGEFLHAWRFELEQ